MYGQSNLVAIAASMEHPARAAPVPTLAGASWKHLPIISIAIVQVMSLEDMAVKMEYYLDEYNVVSSSPMALVMFRYALDHISRCTRVLLQDNGEQCH